MYRTAIVHRAALVAIGAAAVALVSACGSSSLAGSGSVSAPVSPVAHGQTHAAKTHHHPSPPTHVVTSTVPGPTHTVTRTVAPPAPPSSTVPPVPPANFDTFVGTWYAHGAVVRVSPSGKFAWSFRTYTFCSARVRTGCDQVNHTTIIDGGQVRGSISQVINSTTAIVRVDSSSVPKLAPVQPFRIGFDRKNDAIALFTADWADAPLCGAHAPDSYCGA